MEDDIDEGEEAEAEKKETMKAAQALMQNCESLC